MVVAWLIRTASRTAVTIISLFLVELTRIVSCAPVRSVVRSCRNGQNPQKVLQLQEPVHCLFSHASKLDRDRRPVLLGFRQHWRV